MKKGFLKSWLECRTERQKILGELACEILLCRRSIQRAVREAKAGRASAANDMLDVVRTASEYASQMRHKLWIIDNKKLSDTEKVLFEDVEALFTETVKARQAIEEAKRKKC